MRFLLPGEPPPLGQIGAMPFVGPPPRQVQGGAIAPPALGTPSIVGAATTATVASGTTVNGIVPGSITPGDVLFASFSRFGGGVYNTPAGWTRIDAAEHTYLALFYRVVDGSEPATYPFTVTASGALSVAIMALRDCNTINPIDTRSNATATSISATAPGLTTANDNTMLIQCTATGGNRNSTAGTMTERWDIPSPTNHGHADLQATAGASGAKINTLSGSATWYTHLIAIKPSGST